MAQSKPLNIVMVAACPFPANHGSAASIREMSAALVRLGHKVHIVTYPIQEDLPVDGAMTHRVSVPFLRPGKVVVGPSWEKFVYDPLMAIKLLWVMWRYKIDVIHAHNYEGAMIGWVGKLLGRRPMLYNAVNTMADELPSYNFIKPKKFAVWLGNLLDKVVPRSADLITVVSDALKDILVSANFPADKIIVLPAGVELEMFKHGDGDRIREKHGLNDRPVVMYTGAIEEFQRIDYLLQSMAIVAKKIPESRLLIVGSVFNAAQKDKYLALARSIGVESHIEFIDSVSLDDLPDYLFAADVAVVPRPECPGHPVKLLNYMASHRAIVSFVGGAKGLHHMYNGYLAADHDVAELAHGIEFLLEHPHYRAALGEQAYKTLDGNFDWDTLAKGIVILYRHLIARDSMLDMVALRRFLRDGYTMRYVDRRSDGTEPLDSSRRGTDRRTRHEKILFLEKRRVEFGAVQPVSAGSRQSETTP